METGIERCPLCGSESIEWMGDCFDKENSTPYHCHECDNFFGKDTVIRENLRHQLSAILANTNEEKQKECNIVLEPNDSCGLSTLEMPTIVSCFQEPTEGIIWFHFEGHIDLMTGKKNYTEFDEIETKDLLTIYKELCEEFSK